MTTKKRTLSGLCAAALLFTAMLTGCATGTSGTSTGSELPSAQENTSPPSSVSADEFLSGQKTGEKTEIRVGTLKGPAGIGMAYMMEQNDADALQNKYTFTIAGAPDELAPQIINGQLDIAALPTNVGSVLYNKTNQNVSMLTVNTLGVLYVLTKGEEVASIADLKGKTIYATGQGATPQYVLEHLLRENGIDPEKDVTIEYKSEHAELATLVLAGQAPIAVLPQPFVTTVTQKDADVKIALDITKEWRETTGVELAMTCVIVRNDFLAENKEAVDAFVEELRQSTDFANEKPADAAVLTGKYDIIAQAVAEKAIPFCNLVVLQDDDMRLAVENFLKAMFEANPQSVGGALPDEGFYYKK